MSTKETIQELKTNLEQLKQKILDLELSNNEKSEKKKKMIEWFNRRYGSEHPLIDLVFQTPLECCQEDHDTFEGLSNGSCEPGIFKNKGWIKAQFEYFEIWFTSRFYSPAIPKNNIYFVVSKKNHSQLGCDVCITDDNYIYYPFIGAGYIWIKPNLDLFKHFLNLNSYDHQLVLNRLNSLKSMFYNSIGDKVSEVDMFIPKLNGILIEFENLPEKDTLYEE